MLCVMGHGDGIASFQADLERFCEPAGALERTIKYLHYFLAKSHKKFYEENRKIYRGFADTA